jgi:ketosteroid isomerase-like protein
LASTNSTGEDFWLETGGSMEQWELVARESIRDLVARYNANADSGRFDPLMELFAPDAVMELSGEVYTGHDEIRTIFTSTADSITTDAAEPEQGTRHLRHFTSTLQIDVESPTAARSRCYYHVLMAHGLDHWGRYVDEFGVVDGRWRFTRRRVATDGVNPDGWAARLSAES